MNLCVDIGNSFIKLGIFEGQTLKLFKSYEKLFIKDIRFLRETFPFNRVIVSASGKVPSRLLHHFRKEYKLIELSHLIKLPFSNTYKTPKTLGRDRIAGVAGAQVLFPNRSCLVIDIGTCVTFDVIDAKGMYLGGNISPGVELRLKAMSTFTARLPLVKRGKLGKLIGNSTTSALQLGATSGTLHEIQNFINEARALYKGLNVILTGGDAHFFAEQLKTKIFVNPNLVLIGLNKILEINE